MAGEGGSEESNRNEERSDGSKAGQTSSNGIGARSGEMKWQRVNQARSSDRKGRPDELKWQQSTLRENVRERPKA